MRGALEHHGDFGYTLAEALAATQVERHASPAAGVDIEADGGVRFSGALGVDAFFLQVADHFVRALPALGVLAARGVGSKVLGQAHGGKHLGLFGGQVLGGEAHRLLHGGQSHELKQVVLDDVACGADAVVIAGAAADADVLGHRDLHVVHIVGVPDRLVHGVGETQGQQVLHGFLAEVVVDAEHGARVEHFGYHAVEFLGAGQIMTERLLDDHAAPCALGRARQAGGGQLLGDLWECARRHRHVEGMVTLRAAVAVKLLHGGAQTLEGLRVVERTLHEADAGGQIAPSRLLEPRTAMRLDGGLDEFDEPFLCPVAAGETGQTEARRQ